LATFLTIAIRTGLRVVSEGERRRGRGEGRVREVGDTAASLGWIGVLAMDKGGLEIGIAGAFQNVAPWQTGRGGQKHAFKKKREGS